MDKTEYKLVSNNIAKLREAHSACLHIQGHDFLPAQCSINLVVEWNNIVQKIKMALQKTFLYLEQ